MPRIVNDFSFHLDFIAVHSELPFVCSIITRVQYAVFFFGHFRDIRALISVLLCYDHISLKHIQSIDHIILMEHYQYIHYKMSIIEALFFL